LASFWFLTLPSQAICVPPFCLIILIILIIWPGGAIIWPVGAIIWPGGAIFLIILIFLISSPPAAELSAATTFRFMAHFTFFFIYLFTRLSLLPLSPPSASTPPSSVYNLVDNRGGGRCSRLRACAEGGGRPIFNM
jgi:hypothetical protein